MRQLDILRMKIMEIHSGHCMLFIQINSQTHFLLFILVWKLIKFNTLHFDALGAHEQ